MEEEGTSTGTEVATATSPKSRKRSASRNGKRSEVASNGGTPTDRRSRKVAKPNNGTMVSVRETSPCSPIPLQKRSFSLPPKYVLVLDNGGDTVKYGWAVNPDHSGNDSGCQCQYMPNVTARLAQQWTVLIGDEIQTQVKNPNSCIAITRSTERGIITNMGNQIQIWKRILDTLHITISSSIVTETSAAYGWSNGSTLAVSKNLKRQKDRSNDPSIPTTKSHTTIPSNLCAVMIGICPYTPRFILDHIMTIWFEEFHFHQVGFCISTVAAAIYRPISLQTSNIRNDDSYKDVIVPIACVVDLGYSAIHIIPVYDNKVITGITTESSTNHDRKGTIRRIPFGAKHMINIWKYYCSYRQWNLMDSEWIVRDVFEKTAYVSLSFISDMKLARKIPFGRRPYDREYILPNYDTTFIGEVQIPNSVIQEIERMKQNTPNVEVSEKPSIEEEEETSDDENDEDYNDNDVTVDVDDIDDDNDDGPIHDDDDDDEDNESPEQIRQRLLKQREEERRLREIEADQNQILNVSMERYAIPEALFRPSDVGLPSEWANVPQAIVQSIEACPILYRAGLYRSIQLTGGLSNLPNLKVRLLEELRKLVPYQYQLNVSISDSPINQAWMGIANLTQQQSHHAWGVDRDEWENLSKRGAWKRLQMCEGGYLL
jgi:actin-related protein